MRRYLVVAHRTLGGAHLFDHLHALRAEDPHCRFHVVVPVHHPPGAWTEGEVRAEAQRALEEVLERMAGVGIGATGEVGDANPVIAVADAIRRAGPGAFSGIIVSTLPRSASAWWRMDVPARLARTFPDIPVTHLVATGEPASL